MRYLKLIWFFVFITLAMLSAPNAVADITGTWNLSGTLKVDTLVKGKSVSAKKIALPAIVNFNAVDKLKQFSLNTKLFYLPGQWNQNKTTFTTAPDASAIRSLMSLIQKDLQAKSGLALNVEASKWKFSGKEVKTAKSNKLTGTLTIKAKLFFQAYLTNKGEPIIGTLTITYGFTGLKA